MTDKTTYKYRIYGMRLTSDREIVQMLTEERAEALDKAEGVDNSNLPEIKVVFGVPDFIREKGPGFWEIGSKESFLTNKTCWLYVINGEEIHYEVRPGGLDSKLNSYILGFGMAIIAIERGILPIHSSGLYKDGKAVLISGDSGSGKSTLTASYIERGFNLMADDVTFVGPDEDGNALAYPAFPYQKLCRNEVEKRHEGEDGLIYIDEDKDKFLVPWRGEYSANSKPLLTIIYLIKADVENVRIEEIKGLPKMTYLNNAIFMKGLLGTLVFDKNIGEKLLWLASKVRVIGVIRPEEKNTIDEIVEKTMELI